MIPFTPADPFPLIESGTYTYAEAKDHAAEVDQWLGIEGERIEEVVRVNPRYAPSELPDALPQEYWHRLPAHMLNTPYVEIREILSRIKPEAGATVIDLGCGLGRMAHVIGRHYPGVKFVGYECIEERVIAARRSLTRFDYPLVTIELADLTAPDFVPLGADYYFIYDFGSRPAVEKTLNDLRAIAAERRIVVVGRGRLSRFLIEHQHPWLSDICPPEHAVFSSIYRSRD